MMAVIPKAYSICFSIKQENMAFDMLASFLSYIDGHVFIHSTIKKILTMAKLVFLHEKYYAQRGDKKRETQILQTTRFPDKL